VRDEPAGPGPGSVIITGSVLRMLMSERPGRIDFTADPDSIMMEKGRDADSWVGLIPAISRRVVGAFRLLLLVV